ncbi:hypothetical protein ACFOVU_27890 [Nocardiopsis sediminis]|uniref:DUF222 domain-containing protein n=1 Tax=Nocardiopsis sediminis TaxID=1778267 RepID=A0ABV8FV24_9ACTN
MTTVDGGAERLVRAMGLLEECERRLWDHADTGDGIAGLIAEARRRYDEVERAIMPGDTGTAATIAIGRSMAAALDLRFCIDRAADLNSGWDWEWDGPPLGGMREEDHEGVSEPFARQAAEAARAALDADPDEERLGDFEWSDGSRVYGTVGNVCADADAMIAEGIGDLARNELRGMLKLVLEIHRPGRPIAEHDLIARIPGEKDGPLAIDWSDIPVEEALELPLPPGRPLRMDAKTCFYGSGQGWAAEEPAKYRTPF